MSTTDESWKNNPPFAKSQSGWKGYRYRLLNTKDAVNAVFMCADDEAAIAKCTEASMNYAVFLRSPVTFSLERETLGNVMDQIKYHKNLYPGLYQTLLR